MGATGGRDHSSLGGVSGSGAPMLLSHDAPNRILKRQLGNSMRALLLYRPVQRDSVGLSPAGWILGILSPLWARCCLPFDVSGGPERSERQVREFRRAR